ncbi:MAG: aldo/keto reductase [Mycoplasmatales bacterium]|nr:aldo/keto reductase [Mycoplasmatales bacterium]
MKKIKLNDNNEIPIMGMGTWMLKPSKFKNVVQESLKNGINAFDVAQIYNNEASLGDALEELNVKRESVHITTKIWINNYKNKEVFFKSIEQSLKRLKTDYVDLLLLHWPREKDDNVKIYKWLIEAKEKGLTRSIGLSNFDKETIEKLILETGVIPATNHLEIQVHNQQIENVNYCKEKNILVQAYSLLRPYFLEKSFTIMIQAMTDKEKNMIDSIGKNHNKTGPQVILRWAIQKGYQIFPKVTNTRRFKNNLEIFEFKLTKEEMEKIHKMNRVDYKTIDLINKSLDEKNEEFLDKNPLLFDKYFKNVDKDYLNCSAKEYEAELEAQEEKIKEFIAMKYEQKND